jgi:hypothetical protein
MSATSALPDFIGLRQAVLWLGLDLPPQSRALELVDNYPMEISELSARQKLDERERAAVETAMRELNRALAEGRLQALGRPEFCQHGFSYENLHDQPEVYQELLITEGLEPRPVIPDPEAPRRPLTEIPPDWWEPDAIDWDRNRVDVHDWRELEQVAAYIDVRLRTEDVQRLRRSRPRIRPPSENSPARRGPKPIYDKLEFYRLLALETDKNGIPDTQEELIARMELLLAIVWGEDCTPKPTWLKERISPVYALRERYENARQALEHR